MAESFHRLAAFVAVARERSFTKAAAKLGLTQSAVSQAIRELEKRLGLRLLTRTTRKVALTAAGERLFQLVAPRFDEIAAGLTELSGLRDRPAGTVRIAATENAAASVLCPALERLLPAYPDIKVEIVIDYGLTDIVEGQFDAGVRFGETVASGMIAVRIGADTRMAVVGAPSYFASRRTPKTPQQLTEHRCINLRLPTHGGLYAWEFEKAGREVRVRVDGQLILNTSSLILRSAISGLGLAYLPQEQVQDGLKAGQLVQVLDDWCPPFAGYHLYYPSRKHLPPAFTAVVNALRIRQ